jgi:Mrp family chromosome partitioning ATPase
MSRLYDALRRADSVCGIDLPSWLAATSSEHAVPPQIDGDQASVESSTDELASQCLGSHSVLDDGVSGQSRTERAHSEIAKLVQRLFVLRVSGAPRSVVFSAVDNSAARITYRTAQNLAAQVSGSVCLVDANLRAPIIHELFGIREGRGFADAIVNPGTVTDYAFQTNGANLWVLPAGLPVEEPSGLFASHRLLSRMSELKATFRYVLINAPALDTSADAVLLGRFVDGVVLVVNANFTPRERARRASQTFAEAGVRLLGAILSNRD